MALTKEQGTNGDDVFVGGPGIHFAGDQGVDTVDYSGSAGPVTVDLRVGGPQDVGFGGGNNRDQLSSIENLVGTQFNDILVGRDNAGGTLSGGAGDDRLYAGSVGNVNSFTLNGGDGNDTLEGRDGNDTLNGGDGNDGLSAASGNDILNGGLGNDSMLGGLGDDQLVGGAGADRMGGGGGADVFAFGTGDNGLRSAGANDVITDFQQGIDKFQLEAGATATSAFISSAANAGTLITITYADSSVGQVALTNHVALTNSDFI